MQFNLSMTFLTEIPGETQTYTLTNVREDLTQADVEELMDAYIAQNCFVSKKGNLVSKKSATINQFEKVKHEYEA